METFIVPCWRALPSWRQDGIQERTTRLPEAHSIQRSWAIQVNPWVLLASCAAMRKATQSSSGSRRRRRARRGIATRATATEAHPSVAFAEDDVVVVYDKTSKQASEVVVAVERDSSMAPSHVAYAALPSSDSASLAELAGRRGLSEANMARLTRASSACAVLPSGAVIEDLEVDPGPLLRELRYRTCLEAPAANELEQLQRAYLEPLHSLREWQHRFGRVYKKWWENPEAMSLLAQQLDEVGFILIDDFLPEADAKRLKASSLQLKRSSEMQLGTTTGGNNRVGIAHRGDMVKWVRPGSEGEVERNSEDLTVHIQDVMAKLQKAGESSAPTVASALAGVRWHSEAMFTCYPEESRARYFRHTDNSSGNGRLLTAIVYLNEAWEEGHGGELRLFHPGAENLKVRLEVQPLWNRLILFWSDERCPHEVLSACRDRFATTVWYYDQKNPTIPLFEISKSAAAADVSPAEAAAAPPPVAAAAPPPVAAAAPPPVAAAAPPPVAAAAPPPVAAAAPPPVAAAAPPPAPVATAPPPPASAAAPPPAPKAATAPPPVAATSPPPASAAAPPVAAAPPPVGSASPAAAAAAPSSVTSAIPSSTAASKPLIVFFDSRDPETSQLALSLNLGSGEAQRVDLHSPYAAQALREAAGERWSQLLETNGLDALMQEAGSLFLALPSGGLLKHGLQERWMLQYEIDYWQQVQPASEETSKRLSETMFKPLEVLQKSATSEGVWWASPDATAVWGKALANESFIVLDDFLPLPAASALVAAARRLRAQMQPGKTDSDLSAKGRGDMITWTKPDEVPELSSLIEHLNGLVTLMMELPQESVVARLSQISALSDVQVAMFPGDTSPDDARYIRHVDNEDGLNGRLLTCTYYLNENWDRERDGGELRLFEPDQQSVKTDVPPILNRLVAFFSDSSVPHEVRRSRRDRHALTIWYINQELHLAYHEAEEEGQ
eukprot:TRINITY_DN4912_c0_g3_i1.p1 TRINITY_DN4912_c0_g3~~TRINITY_DN4912_c0_g3_i1.p1  ORF type:complete len:954 (-),score=238.38 TRINITY_DN4912_c0_g3_i1:34-2895(-)